MNKFFDFHIHTKYSDGSNSPEEVIQKLREKGIFSFAITDHDTIEGVLAAAPLIPDDMFFMNGIEFSSKTPSGKCHILGYQFDPSDAMLLQVIEHGRLLRQAKLEKRLDYLAQVFGIPFTEEEKEMLRKMPSVGKPHLASLLIKKGFADSIDQGIKTYINKCPGENTRISASEIIPAILHAGGIPVWAHPLGGEGEKRLSEEEFQNQLSTLLSLGINGLECYYSRYTLKEIDFLLAHAKKYDLQISGGSDYHGKNKNIELGTLCAEDDLIIGETPYLMR